MRIFERLESEVRSYCRSFPKVFDTARDSLIFDTDGRAYIDFLSSAGTVNYGHNNARLRREVITYLEKEGLIAGLDFHTTAKKEFIEKFQACILKPRKLNYKVQFTGPTGTSVVESAVKLARKYTGRSNVVAFTNSFHGMSATSLSLTGARYHRQQYMAGNVTRLPFDGYMGSQLDTIAYFQKLLSDSSSGLDLPAAVVLETIQAEGGVNIASPEWLKALRTLTEAYDILLIIDDIQVGCGRTGRFFSFERAGIVPDMVCLSKSLSGIGLPFSLLLLKKELDVWKPGEDNGTFRGNNLAFVSAAAAIDEYWADIRLEQHISHLATIVTEWLSHVRGNYQFTIKETRGLGLIHGTEFSDPGDAAAVATCCFEDGLIVETCGANGQVLKLLPSLTISEKTLREGLAIIGNAIDVSIKNKASAPSVLAAHDQ